LTVPNALEVISKVAAEFSGRVLVGAGTITNSAQPPNASTPAPNF